MRFLLGGWERKGGGGPLCHAWSMRCDCVAPPWTCAGHRTTERRKGDRGGQMGVAAMEEENVTAERLTARDDTEIILGGMIQDLGLFLPSDWSPCDASCDQFL